ncbi:MAG: SUV3 C-terminal domain-containing protein [Campylobacterota bacterium]|nr:SUV3 C-terminal domain-containing protein [Campylobacterota bacterium]
MQNNWQEQLQTLLNCDLKSLYPLARSIKRELHFYVGPTNSGKTYTAMQELQKAHCGTYLAPLRLLALEGYETLQNNDIAASLITGEEQIFDEEAGHICSTIEMIDFNMDVDVCVIDEVQMLSDIDRGWAWVNAIVGSPAKKVIMTGSVNALEAIKKIAKYLDEPLYVEKFKRINDLKVLPRATAMKEIEPYTALIAFSRNDVLKYKQKLSKFYNVSVLYGNLSPEVRKEEAKRFREGKTNLLIATDAIAMGLNLPIKTILFTTDTKFDGISQRKLMAQEIIQIAGRAGRYGHHEVGYIGALNSRKVLAHITEEFNSPIPTNKPPFGVKATPFQIEELSNHLKTKSLYKILDYFARHMNFTGPFKAANLKGMLQISKILDNTTQMKLEEKFLFSQAPVSINAPLIRSAFMFYIRSVQNNQNVSYKTSAHIGKVAKSEAELLKAEDEVKKISLYLWLSYKFPNHFTDTQQALENRVKINQFIEKSLKANIKPKRPTQHHSKEHHNKRPYRGRNRKFNR